MLGIVTHIERLLLVHDCVIVPKFGGFVLREIPAQMREAEQSFLPPRKEIGFNAALQHVDGLLCGSYMQSYAVSYEQAQRMLEEDVEEMRRLLRSERTLPMGLLGSFRMGEEGQPVFCPGDAGLFSVGSYGLPVFHFPVLASLKPETEEVRLPLPEKKEKKDIFYIPVSRSLLRAVAASAAAVMFFLMLSTPVKDVGPGTYAASFVPAEIAPVGVAEQQSAPETATGGEPVPETPAAISGFRQPEAVHPEPVRTTEKRGLPRLKTYYVVIGSFPTGKQADEYLVGVDRRECVRAGIVTRDGKSRVYADKFDNREEAENCLSVLRVRPEYKDAWLFICR